MKLAVATISLFVAVALCGCSSTVTRETLMRKATRHSLTLMPDTTYYCGSARGFDFFYIEPTGPTTFRRAHLLRTREAENTVTNRFEYTTERSRWRVLVGLDRNTK